MALGVLDPVKKTIGSELKSLGETAKKQVTTIPKNMLETGVEQVGLKIEGGAERPANYSERQDKLAEQSTKDMMEALYGPSTPPEKPVEQPAQTSTEQKSQQVGLREQFGFGKQENNTVSLKGQFGMGKSEDTTETLSGQFGLTPNKNTVGLADQMSQLAQATVQKTPEEQQKAAQEAQQKHSEYYQDLTAYEKQQAKPDTEAREKEEREKIENAAQRAERMKFEDEEEKKKKQEKQKPMAVQMGQESAEKFRGAAG